MFIIGGHSSLFNFCPIKKPLGRQFNREFTGIVVTVYQEESMSFSNYFVL